MQFLQSSSHVISKFLKVSFFTSARLFTALIAFQLFYLCGCDDNPVDKNPPCPPFQTVPTPPYDSPAWHPTGEFIGVNYTPLIKITYPYGEHCQGVYEWDSDKEGFWLINTDGTNMHRIFPYKLYTPAWSPDGEWIAFMLPIGDERHIFKMHFNGNTLDTNTVVQLTNEGRNFFPSWSPDGQWIAYDSNVNSPNGMQFIWKMKSDGTQKTRIAFEPAKGEIRMPSWSNEGNKLVHTRYSTEFVSQEIFLMNPDGSNPSRLTTNTKDDRHPQFAYDNTIVFWSDGNLWIMDSSGTNQRKFLNQTIDYIFSISLSNEVVYTIYDNTWTYENGTLWIIDLITGEKRQLTFNPKPN